MLVPLTRKTFESLIPPVATGAQYIYCWGKLTDLLRRILISVVGVLLTTLVVGSILGLQEVGLLRFIVGVFLGLYWLWGPVLWASLRNLEYRKYAYSGFWQGEVIDVYVTEELIGKEETVNDRGDLVIVENRERCFNIEVGDETGFSTSLQVPLKRSHQAIGIGDVAEMLVLSNRGDLGRIHKTSDIYIPNNNIWVSDYPYLQREAFAEVSHRLKSRERSSRGRRDQPEQVEKSRNSRGERTRQNDLNDEFEPSRPRRSSRRKPSVDR